MTPEQASLLSKAEESLQAAKLLANNNFYGFSASRSYYSMFYIAEAFLLGENLSFSSHSAVISAFGREFARTGRVPAEFHRYLIDSQDRQNQGDYSIDNTITAEQALEQIGYAERFGELAREFLNAPSP